MPRAGIIHLLRSSEIGHVPSVPTFEQTTTVLYQESAIPHLCPVPTPNLEGTRSTITLTWSPSGKVFAATHADHSVRIYSSTYGTLLSDDDDRDHDNSKTKNEKASFLPSDHQRKRLPDNAVPLAILHGHHRTPWSVRFHPYRDDIIVSGGLARIPSSASSASATHTASSSTPQGEIIVWHWPTSTPLFIASTHHHALSVTFSNNGSMVFATVGKEIYVYPYLFLHYTNILDKTLQIRKDHEHKPQQPSFLPQRNPLLPSLITIDEEESLRNENYYFSLLRYHPDEAFGNPAVAKNIYSYLLDQCIRNHHYTHSLHVAKNSTHNHPSSLLPSLDNHHNNHNHISLPTTDTSATSVPLPTPDSMLPLFILDSVIRSITIVSNLAIERTEDPLSPLSAYVNSAAPSSTNEGDSLSYLIASLEKPAQLQKSSASSQQSKDSAGPVIMWLLNEYALTRCIYAYHTDCTILANRYEDFSVPPSKLATPTAVPIPISPTAVWKSVHSNVSLPSSITTSPSDHSLSLPTWKPVSYVRTSSSLSSSKPPPSPPSSSGTDNKDATKGKNGIYEPPSLPPGQPWRIPVIPPYLAYETAKRLANEYGDYIATNCTKNKCTCGWCAINPDCRTRSASFLSTDPLSTATTRSIDTMEHSNDGTNIPTTVTASTLLCNDTLSSSSLSLSTTANKYSLLVSILYDLILRDTDETNRKLCYYERIFDSTTSCVVGPILLSRSAVVFNDNGLSVSTRNSLHPHVMTVKDLTTNYNASSSTTSSSLILATVSSPPPYPSPPSSPTHSVPTNGGKWGIPTEPVFYHHYHPDVYTKSVFGYVNFHGCNCTSTDKFGCSYEFMDPAKFVSLPSPDAVDNSTPTPSESLRYEYARAIHALIARIAPTASVTNDTLTPVLPTLLITKPSIRYHHQSSTDSTLSPDAVMAKRNSIYTFEPSNRHQRVWSIASNDSFTTHGSVLPNPPPPHLSPHPPYYSTRSPSVSFSSTMTNSVSTHRRPYSYSTSSSQSDSTHSRLSLVPAHNTSTSSLGSLVTVNGENIDGNGTVRTQQGPTNATVTNSSGNISNPSNVQKLSSSSSSSSSSSIFSPLLRSLFGVKATATTTAPSTGTSSSTVAESVPSSATTVSNNPVTITPSSGTVTPPLSSPSILSSASSPSRHPTDPLATVNLSRPPSSPSSSRTVSRSSFSTMMNNHPHNNHSPGGNRKRSFADHESISSFNGEDGYTGSNSPVPPGTLVSSSTPTFTDHPSYQRNSMNTTNTPEGYSVRRTSFNTTVSVLSNSNGSVYRARGDTPASLSSSSVPPVPPPLASSRTSRATSSASLTNYSMTMNSPLNPSANSIVSPRGSFASHSHPRSSFGGGSFSGSSPNVTHTLSSKYSASGLSDNSSSERLRSISSVAALAAAAMEGLVLDDIVEEGLPLNTKEDGSFGRYDDGIVVEEDAYRLNDDSTDRSVAYTNLTVTEKDPTYTSTNTLADSSLVELWCGLIHVSLWQRLLIWTGVPDPIHDMIHGKDEDRMKPWYSFESGTIITGSSGNSNGTSKTPTDSSSSSLPSISPLKDTFSGILRIQNIRVPPLPNRSSGSGSYSLPYLPCHFGRALCQWRTENIIANSISSIQIAPCGGHVLLGIEPSTVPIPLSPLPQSLSISSSQSSSTAVTDMYNHVLLGTAQLSIHGNTTTTSTTTSTATIVPPPTPINPSAPLNRTILRSIRLDNGQSSLEITAPTTAVNAVAWNPYPSGKITEKGSKHHSLWGFIYGTQRGQIRRVAAAASIVKE